LNWEGVEEGYADELVNENGMYDFGEFIPEEHDLNGDGKWGCNDCVGEWGYVEWICGNSYDNPTSCSGTNYRIIIRISTNPFYISPLKHNHCNPIFHHHLNRALRE
jgi:hypothetical protein